MDIGYVICHITWRWGAMREAILMTLLAVVSSSAAAAWWPVGSDETRTAYSDSSTVRRTGNIAKMWSMMDYKSARENAGKPYMSTKSQLEFDCKEEQYRMLYLSFYSKNMGEGETVGSASDPVGRWTPVMPDSATETLWKIACGKK